MTRPCLLTVYYVRWYACALWLSNLNVQPPVLRGAKKAASCFTALPASQRLLRGGIVRTRRRILEPVSWLTVPAPAATSSQSCRGCTVSLAPWQGLDGALIRGS